MANSSTLAIHGAGVACWERCAAASCGNASAIRVARLVGGCARCACGTRVASRALGRTFCAAASAVCIVPLLQREGGRAGGFVWCCKDESSSQRKGQLGMRAAGGIPAWPPLHWPSLHKPHTAGAAFEMRGNDGSAAELTAVQEQVPPSPEQEPLGAQVSGLVQQPDMHWPPQNCILPCTATAGAKAKHVHMPLASSLFCTRQVRHAVAPRPMLPSPADAGAYLAARGGGGTLSTVRGASRAGSVRLEVRPLQTQMSAIKRAKRIRKHVGGSTAPSLKPALADVPAGAAGTQAAQARWGCRGAARHPIQRPLVHTRAW